MMTQTLALLLDAYRELNARKLFWSVLILNVLVMAAFATLGVSGDSMTFLWYQPFRGLLGATEYKMYYDRLVVGLWFTWIATILALISTAGVFPDLMVSGSIDIYLSKPIGRLRLFATKYLSGLLFVALQVGVFSLASFIVLGWRGGVWEPGIFWAIPLFVLFYSYLFGICVLLGVWTRSAIAALLITLLLWVGMTAISFVDSQAGTFVYVVNLQYDALNRQIAALDTRIAAAGNPADQAGREQLDSLRSRRAALAVDRDKSIPPQGVQTARTVLFYIESVMPKTRETLNLLNRALFQDEELKSAISPNGDDSLPAFGPPGQRGRIGGRGTRDALSAAQMEVDRERPVWWIIGTSLLFEAVCLALAAWHFCTRDF